MKLMRSMPGVPSARPAQENRAWTGAPHSSTAASIDALSDRSSLIALTPSSVTSARSMTTTSAPASFTSSAVAAPIPVAPPTTRARLPSNLKASNRLISSLPVSACRPGDRLRLQILLEPSDAVLAADAAVLVAPERHVRAHGHTAVDGDEAGPDAAGDGEGALERPRRDHAGEPVLALVGDANGVVVVLERDDDEDRAEDLLLGDRHRVVDVDEHRRLDVPAFRVVRRAAAAEGKRRPLLLALLDVAQDPVALLLGDQWAHHHVRALRVAVGRHAQVFLELLNTLVVARPGKQHPRWNGAALAGVEAHGESRQQGRIEVGVVEHDVRRLAAELEEGALHRRRPLLHDALADRRG